MDPSVLPRGLIADLITPLRDDRSVDREGLKRLVMRLRPHVQALLVGSPYGGEGLHLTSAQRLDLVEGILELPHGPIPLLVWVTAPSEAETRGILKELRQMAQHSESAGSLAWVNLPLYYHSNRGLADHYRDLVAEMPWPALLHNDPRLIRTRDRPLKRANIRTRILGELSRLPAVAGIIFSGSLQRAHNYRRATGRPDFRIYDGEESRFLRTPSMSGVVSVGANLVPAGWARLTRSCLGMGGSVSAPDSLHQIWHTGRTLLDLAEKLRDTPAQTIKGLLYQAGVIETPVCFSASGRPPDITAISDLLRQISAL